MIRGDNARVTHVGEDIGIVEGGYLDERIKGVGKWGK